VEAVTVTSICGRYQVITEFIAPSVSLNCRFTYPEGGGVFTAMTDVD